MSSKSKRKHLIIPVFIPYEGCPHKCIYCRQDKITGRPEKTVHAGDVKLIIEQAVSSSKFKNFTSREVAFYGGTFTSLGYERMTELLGAVSPYIEDKKIDSIRLSTRPDEIDSERLRFLKSNHVETVELGVQSMDNEVLKLSNRGHSSENTIEAVKLLKEHNFHTGVQLMPGLPGDSGEKFINTVKSVIDLKPHIARLYPAVVIRETPLENMYRKGRYSPLSLEDAVKICAEGCRMLEDAGIRVIRIGLMSSPSLLEEGRIVAGPWHEAFGFLVRSEIYHNNIRHLLPGPGETSEIGIRIPADKIPLLRGHKNEGVKRIEETRNTKISYIKPFKTDEDQQIQIDIIKQGKSWKKYSNPDLQQS